MKCPNDIDSLSYGNLSERIHKQAVDRRIPVNGMFEITYRCNLNCIHCYCNLSADNLEEVKKELSFKQICKIIDQVVEEGCLWLLITGGEPLIRDDFLSIYTYAKKKGLIISLFTNGSLLNKEVVEYLREYPPFLVEITLYSMRAQIHDSLTRTPGSLGRTLDGIDLLLKHDIRLNLKSTITKINKSEIEEMKRYAKGLGLNFRFDPVLNPRYDGSKNPCLWRISPQEVLELDFADAERSKGWREFCKKRLPSRMADGAYTCGAGVSSFYVNPYGDFQICLMTGHQRYSINSFSFKEVWHKFFPEAISQKHPANYECNACDIVLLCGSCLGWAHMENGNADELPQHLCEIARLREKHFR